jgi:hypothetical protein
MKRCHIRALGGREMRHRIPLAVAVLIGIGVLVLAGCGGSGDEAASEPATVEAIAGTDLSRVILTSEAAERLDVQTAPVRNQAGKRTVPYSAVLYDPNGQTWTYTSPKHLVFVRQDISVDRIDGDVAILSAGPRPGTAVVTVGAPEIWGVEYGGIEED